MMRIQTTCVLLMVLFSGLTPCAAQFENDRSPVSTGGLDVEAEAGWDGFVDRSGPVPISFLFGNYSKEIIEGELFLLDHLNAYEISLGEVYLIQQSQRRLTTIQAMETWNECYAELRSGNRVLWRQELLLYSTSGISEQDNVVLVINDSSRALEPPRVRTSPDLENSQEARIDGDQNVALATERNVRYVQVKTWQVPTHPGPLLTARAVIFPEGTAVDELNDGQWQAVADWACQGGAVFVHKDSADLMDKLSATSHLLPDLPKIKGGFTSSPVGLGAIHQYADRLFDQDTSRSNQLIAEHVGKMIDDHPGIVTSSGLVTAPFLRVYGGPADRNRTLVVAFFGLYTLFSGLVALFSFRRSRRFVVTYMVCVVSMACVMAVSLGGYLRTSEGELRLATVTQAGAGGVVQVGRMVVQSAGARNTQVTVLGDHADLQVIEEPQFSRYYRPQVSPSRSFTWQRNQLDSAEDAYQVSVSMPPWGNKWLHATCYSSALPALEFRLDYEPSRSGSVLAAPSGSVKVKLKNRLPFTLLDCVLLVGHAPPLPESEAEIPNGIQPNLPRPLPPRADVYAMIDIGTLDAGDTIADSYVLQLAPPEDQWSRDTPHKFWQTMPNLVCADSSSAWILARLTQSPVMSIDDEHTDFVLNGQFHVFMQEILPEHMPDLTPLAEESIAPER